MVIRQPIVSVLGHVDHGKTSLLDRIRGTTVAAGEAGRITQHIGATEVPIATIQKVCGPLMAGRSFEAPGLLFIDTPGHHAFTSLRARGGALADIAILVVDITEGLKPQTKEALTILRRNRTPFVMAANKLDLIHAWESRPDAPFVQSLPEQTERVTRRLDEHVYELIGEVYETTGRTADRYDRIDDFTKKIAIVPVSAETGEGLPDLLLVLMGLAQRFLEDRLEADLEGRGRGTVLEVKEEKGFGLTLDTIVYDGALHQGDSLVVATPGEPRLTKVKALLKPKALEEIRATGGGWTTVEEVHAAAGVKVAAPDLEGVLSGAPFVVAQDDDVDAAIQDLEGEFDIDLELQEEGLIVKADTLGSLEALAFELKDRGIPIHRAEVGDVARRDVVEASTIGDPLLRGVLAFNVAVLPDARETLRTETEHTALLASDVIYQLLDDYEAWVEKRTRALEAERRGELVHPGKFLVLRDHTFRMSKPAIVGVRVIGGRLRPGQRILRQDGRVVGPIKSIRDEETSLDEAKQGDEVAIAIEGVTMGRQLEEGEQYYVDIPGGDARTLFQEVDLNATEQDILEEVAGIKREEDRFWGM